MTAQAMSRGFADSSVFQGVTDMDTVLATDPRFRDKRWFLGLLGSVVYAPTGEAVVEGFRYFRCTPEDLVRAYRSGDGAAIAALERAIDEDGDADTRACCLKQYYTTSGSMVALQPQVYIDSQPTLVAEPWILEGDHARAWVAFVRDLDQST